MKLKAKEIIESVSREKKKNEEHLEFLEILNRIEQTTPQDDLNQKIEYIVNRLNYLIQIIENQLN